MSKLVKYKFSALYTMSSGISSKPEQAGHGSPFLSFKAVFNSYFLPDTLPDMMDSSEKEQNTYSVKKGDIFLTRTSETIDELGMSSVALKDYPKATYSGFLKRLHPIHNNISNEKYMAFYLRSKLFRKTMTHNSIMTLRASLNEEIFSYLELHLPDYNTQKDIGDLLFLFNSKIELNNRINIELAAMSKLLYDYWFVQFDFPDKNSRPYKTSGGIMVWNEELKREIPEGWNVQCLGDICNIYQSQTISEKDMSNDAEYNVFGANGVIGKFNKFNHIDSEIVVTCRGNSCGNITRTYPYSWITGNAMVLKLTDINIHNEFIYCSLPWLNIKRAITGSAQPQITRVSLSPLKILMPEKEVLRKYSSLVVGSVSKRLKILKENQQLSSLRDWLLPMLMNGQVTVGGSVEKKIEYVIEEEMRMVAEQG